MNLLEKATWYITNFEEGSFNNNSNMDWDKIEAELLDLTVKTYDGSMVEKVLELDIHYVIPYRVRLSMHKKLVELEPKNIKAIQDYAFYLKAFGDPPDELIAEEMLKRLK